MENKRIEESKKDLKLAKIEKRGGIDNEVRRKRSTKNNEKETEETCEKRTREIEKREREKFYLALRTKL